MDQSDVGIKGDSSLGDKEESRFLLQHVGLIIEIGTEQQELRITEYYLEIELEPRRNCFQAGTSYQKKIMNPGAGTETWVNCV